MYRRLRSAARSDRRFRDDMYAHCATRPWYHPGAACAAARRNTYYEGGEALRASVLLSRGSRSGGRHSREMARKLRLAVPTTLGSLVALAAASAAATSTYGTSADDHTGGSNDREC